MSLEVFRFSARLRRLRLCSKQEQDFFIWAFDGIVLDARLSKAVLQVQEQSCIAQVYRGDPVQGTYLSWTEH